MATTSTCPYCHQTKFDASVGLLHSGHSMEEEVSFLHAEARRLELLVSQIHAQRTSLFRRLNNIQSATGILPSEILSLVFQKFCAYYPRDHGALCVGEEEEDEEDEWGNREVGGRGGGLHAGGKVVWYDICLALRLSSVSSHWREVAHSTPQLWGTFCSNPVDNTTNDTPLISLALERSCGVPMRFEFDFGLMQENQRANLVLLDPSVDEQLDKNLSRMAELNLVHPPKKWLEIGPQLLQVSRLAIASGRHDSADTPGVPQARDSELCLANSLSLRSLTLVSVSKQIRLPSAPRITILNLDQIQPDICIQLLLQCPKLVIFRAVPSQSRISAPAPTPVPRVTFEDLRIFRWSVSPDTWGSHLVRSIHLPALAKLSWSSVRGVPGHFERFFSTLPPTLRSLSFGTFGYDYLLAPRLQAVVNLTLDRCTEEFVLTAMHRLGEMADGEFLLFPRLKRINLDGLPGGLSHGFFEKLVDMCERRVEKGIAFYLEITVDFFEPEWPDFAEKRLMGLQPGLTLTADGRPCFPTFNTPELWDLI